MILLYMFLIKFVFVFLDKSLDPLKGLGTDDVLDPAGVILCNLFINAGCEHQELREIAKKIEDEMEYPGQIKVNIIRESRATDFAK